MLYIMTSDVYRNCIENDNYKREVYLINYNCLYNTKKEPNYFKYILPSVKDSEEYKIYLDSKDFDLNYGLYLSNNIDALHEIMQIMIALHSNYDVVILVSKKNNDDSLLQSFCKWIQQRYGCNANWCFEVEDFENVKLDDPIFSIGGLKRFDEDRERINAFKDRW